MRFMLCRNDIAQTGGKVSKDHIYLLLKPRMRNPIHRTSPCGRPCLPVTISCS
jgi:hypothetical protein